MQIRSVSEEGLTHGNPKRERGTRQQVKDGQTLEPMIPEANSLEFTL